MHKRGASAATWWRLFRVTSYKLTFTRRFLNQKHRTNHAEGLVKDFHTNRSSNSNSKFKLLTEVTTQKYVIFHFSNGLESRTPCAGKHTKSN